MLQPGLVRWEPFSLVTLLLLGGAEAIQGGSVGSSSGHGWEGGFQHPEGDGAFRAGVWGGVCTPSQALAVKLGEEPT